MKDDRVYLLHMRDAAAQLIAYAKDGKEHFLADRRTQDAVVWNLQVLGEAAKNVSAGLRARYPDVPWRSITGTRDKIVHEYFGINHLLLWDVLSVEIPNLAAAIDSILEDLGPGP